MTQLEKDIEKGLRRLVGKYDGLCLKWVCPGWAGVPDRIVLLPGGRIAFVETKRPKGGTLSAMQVKWLAWLADLGFPAFVVWNQQDLDRFKQEWLENEK